MLVSKPRREKTLLMELKEKIMKKAKRIPLKDFVSNPRKQ